MQSTMRQRWRAVVACSRCGLRLPEKSGSRWRSVEVCVAHLSHTNRVFWSSIYPTVKLFQLDRVNCVSVVTSFQLELAKQHHKLSASRCNVLLRFSTGLETYMQIQFIFKFNVNYAETTVLTIPMINIGTNIFWWNNQQYLCHYFWEQALAIFPLILVNVITCIYFEHKFHRNCLLSFLIY